MRGAYSLAPHLAYRFGRWVAVATVEAWRGMPAELLSPAREMVACMGGGDKILISATLTWLDATHEAFDDLDDVQGRLDADIGQILAIRIHCSRPEGTLVGTFLARPTIPGVQLEIMGDDKTLVLGTAEIVFRRMMIGYVDRMGGFRGPAWMLSALAPIFLVAISVTPSQVPLAARLLIIGVATAGSVGTFLLMYRYLLVSVGLHLVDFVPPPRSGWKGIVRLLVEFYAYSWVKPVLAAVSTVVLSIIGTKVADLIPWP